MYFYMFSNILFMTAEVVGGIRANSLAILTDPANLLSDVAAFAISLWASGWEANPRKSYWFFRIEILGTLGSILMIWLLAGIIFYQAIERLINDTGEVQGRHIFLVAVFGLVVNIIMVVMLGHDHGDDHGHYHDHEHSHSDDHGSYIERVSYTTHGNSHHSHEAEATEPSVEKKTRNINVQGSYLHVLGDLIQSIGVMIGKAVIWYKPEWKIIDLICTLIFSVVVLVTTIKILRKFWEVLMESMPREIDAMKVEEGLCEMDEVDSIHELHIWAITIGKVSLTCHVKVKPDVDAYMVLDKVIGYIRSEYNISHVTIQIERE